MGDKEILQQLSKIEYHIRLLNEQFERGDLPSRVSSLIISNDWDERQINRAFEIFEEFEGKIDAAEEINHSEFEAAFVRHLDVDYQALKSVIGAFFDDDHYGRVCRAYVRSFKGKASSEYYRIMPEPE
ncbi:hypothetical protein [Methylocella sp.]|jgi:hypothetical protein|uniref:hypothetical protein n=1 Tax=Methylocella sp. TaxID=1978226 RepID=UPI003C147466